MCSACRFCLSVYLSLSPLGMIPPPCRFRFLPLLVAAVALPGLDLRLGLVPDVLRERAAHVVALVEAATLVAAHVTLVRARVDQLAVVFIFLRHEVPPCNAEVGTRNDELKRFCLQFIVHRSAFISSRPLAAGGTD